MVGEPRHGFCLGLEIFVGSVGRELYAGGFRRVYCVFAAVTSSFLSSHVAGCLSVFRQVMPACMLFVALVLLLCMVTFIGAIKKTAIAPKHLIKIAFKIRRLS